MVVLNQESPPRSISEWIYLQLRTWMLEGVEANDLRLRPLPTPGSAPELLDQLRVLSPDTAGQLVTSLGASASGLAESLAGAVQRATTSAADQAAAVAGAGCPYEAAGPQRVQVRHGVLSAVERLCGSLSPPSVSSLSSLQGGGSAPGDGGGVGGCAVGVEQALAQAAGGLGGQVERWGQALGTAAQVHPPGLRDLLDGLGSAGRALASPLLVFGDAWLVNVLYIGLVLLLALTLLKTPKP